MKKLLPIFFIFLSSLFLSFKIPFVFATEVDTKCDPQYVSQDDKRTPRPAECNICSQNDLLTPSCANSFNVFNQVPYSKFDKPPITTTWSGEIIVNPDEIKIPFVGMKNKDKEKETFGDWFNPFKTIRVHLQNLIFWEVSNASESKYLADYFEGTNEYYRNYGNQNTISNYEGVLRKLTPYEYQNQLKRQVVSRVDNGESDQIHDYKIKYIGRFCWDTPFWMDAGQFIFKQLTQLTLDNTLNKILAFFSGLFNFENTPRLEFNPPDIGHYCLYSSPQEGVLGWFIVTTNENVENLPIIGPIYRKLLELSQIPGLIHFSLEPTAEGNLSDLTNHQPPDPNEEKYKGDFLAYEKDFLNWKYDENGNLSEWYRLWQATPMLSREDTQGEITPYPADEVDTFTITSDENSTLLGVPHVARLYEGSKIISDLLTPVWNGEKTIEMVKSPEIPQDSVCIREKYTPPTDEGDTLCCQTVKATFQATDQIDNPDYETCQEALSKVKTLQAVITTLTEEGFSELKETLQTVHECSQGGEAEVSRAFGVNLKLPYLDEIWSYTANANGGFFNIFRPYGTPTFEDIDAAQTISYSYNPKGLTINGEVSPQEGLFFFPHLGGIETAKEWVVNQSLWPYEEK